MFSLHPDTIKYADSLATQNYGIEEITLMRRAAKGCFDYILSFVSKEDKIVILCGKGNNGGDGYELANLLKKANFDVCVINVFDCEPSSETSKIVYNECLENGVSILSSEAWKTALNDASVIIDALFGVGFYGEIDQNSKIGTMLTFCNTKDALKIAIDTPSGINSADGRAEGVVFKADHTVTMVYYKTGMLSYPAREYCGDISVVDIGYPEELMEIIPKHAIIPDDEYVKETLPKRNPNSHKGSYGRLLMYVASENMTGAGVLSAMAALRTGCGLINMANNKETINKLQAHLLEPIFSPIDEETEESTLTNLSEKATAVLVGCGLGVCDNASKNLFSLIKNASCNIIIDADGINMLSMNKLILKEAHKTPIITPHPLEFSRLTGKSVKEIQSDRINLAKDFAKEYGCIVVLKGASTIIASPDGKLCVNTSGNAGLSKGGSGDVLAGVISSLCAQGIPPFESAVLGVYLHGKAADILMEEISMYGLLPSDLPLAIAKLLP